MAAIQSNIDVLFRVLGTDEAQAQLKALAQAASLGKGTADTSDINVPTSRLVQLGQSARSAFSKGMNFGGGIYDFTRVGGLTQAVEGQLAGVGRVALGQLEKLPGLATSFAKNLGGIVPAFEFGSHAAESLYGFLEKAEVQTIAVAVAAHEVGEAFASVYESTAELTSTVLALRAVNDEIDKKGSLPSFAPGGTKDPFGLVDTTARPGSKYADDFAYLNRIAYTHGQVINQVSDEYVKLKAATEGSDIPLEDIRNVFTGVNDEGLTLGLSATQIQRADLALQHIASTGQVYSRNLKTQLANDIPGALGVAARGFGETTGQLLADVEAGTVSASDFFHAFGQELKVEYAGAAVAAANTTRVALGQLQGAFFNAKASIGSGKLDNTFRDLIQSATNLIRITTNDGGFQRFGAQLAAGLDPLLKHFQGATNDSTGLEHALTFVAGAFSLLVRVVDTVITAFSYFAQGMGNLIAIFAGYQTGIPRLGSLFIGLAHAFEVVTEAISVRKLTGNGYIDFFVALYVLAEKSIQAVFSLFNINPGAGLTRASTVFERIAQYMVQISFALDAFTTGYVSAGLNSTGAGILVNLIRADQAVKALYADAKKAFDVITGKDVPAGADLATQHLYALRDQVVDLISGKDAHYKFNLAGQVIATPQDLGALFLIRDVVLGIIQDIYANRGIFVAIFEGAAGTLRVILATIRFFKPAFDAVAQSLFFKDFTELLGVIVGIGLGLDIARKILGPFGTALKVVTGLFSPLIKAAQALSLALAIPTGDILLIVGAIALLAYVIGLAYHNAELIGDNIGPLMKRVGGIIVDVLADIVSFIQTLIEGIPILGKFFGGVTGPGLKALSQGLHKDAEGIYADAEKDAEANTAERTKRHGGKDPFADGPAGAFGFKFSDILKGIGLTDGQTGLTKDGKMIGDVLQERQLPVIDQTRDANGKLVNTDGTPADDTGALVLDQSGNLVPQGNGPGQSLDDIDATLKQIASGNYAQMRQDQADQDTATGRQIVHADGATDPRSGLQPVVVNFPNGDQGYAYVDPEDTDKFVDGLGSIAQNRAGPMPAWSN